MRRKRDGICSFFNSHPHKEDDVWKLVDDYDLELFNSHPHKEDDGMLRQWMPE